MFPSVFRSRMLLRQCIGTIRKAGKPHATPRPTRRQARPAVEQLEVRDNPSAPPMVATSYFDSAVYKFDSGSGALLSTLVAPSYSPAMLSHPAGVTLGPDGNLYISSQGNDSIVKYDLAANTLSTFIPSTVLTPIATGIGDTQFSPAGLQFGSDGNLYVSLNGAVRPDFSQDINAVGAVVRFGVTTNAGVLSYGGTATTIAANLVWPTELTFGTASGDSNNLYVSNSRADDVIKVTGATSATPTSSTFIATPSAATPDGGMQYPSGLTWGQDGKLYVVDLYSGTVLQFNSDGSFSKVMTPTGTGQAGNLAQQFPSSIIFDGQGHMLTANLGATFPPTLGGSINQYNTDGTFDQTLVSSTQFPSTGPGTSGIAPSQLTLVPGPASQLVISNLSSTNITAGGTVTFTVTAEDSANQVVPAYNGTVQLTSTDTNAMFGGNPLPATYTFVPSDDGVHSFTVTLDTAGSKTITLTDQANVSLTATTSPITVAAGTFSKFVVKLPNAVNTTVVAGSSFLVTAQAADTFGNSVTTYSGPTNITASVSPGDPQQGNFPINATVNSSGFAFFLGNLPTVGSYTLTATAGTFTGSLPGVSVTAANAYYFTLTVPSTATTGSAFDVTVKAFDHYSNVATGYTGTVKLTSTDPLVPTPVASYTFTSGSGLDNGIHTFASAVALQTAGSQMITATQTSAPLVPTITGTSSPITTRGLTVTSLTPTPTGFKVSFSKPVATSNVTLYGPGAAVQDVVLVGKTNGAANGPVGGSLIFDSTGMNAEFKATANTLNVFNGLGAPVLLDDQYTVTLVSGTTNGFKDSSGAPLDGGGGIGGNGGTSNFVFTFPTTGTTHYQSQADLALPDFARGPNDAATLQAPIIGTGTNSAGIPITLYNAAGVTDVTFTLTYNPALFVLNATPTSIVDSSGTGVKTLTKTSSGTGTATFHYTNTVAQPAGTLVLGDILATDPSASKTSYGVKDLMTLSAITVNGSAFTGVASNGIHVNTYFGDVSGDGKIDAVDVAKMAPVQAAAPGVDTGFSAYAQLDPVIVGDVANDLSIDAGDLSTLKGFLLHLAAPLISTPPGLTGITAPNAADPILSLASAAQTSNGIVSVPILLDDPHPQGSTGVSEAVLALTYDPSVLNVSASDITLGTLPGKDWQIISDVDALKGQIGILLYSMTPITATQGGSLVNIAFHVRADATFGATAVRLVDSVTPGGQQYGTALADDQSGLVLSPGMDRVVIEAGGPASQGISNSEALAVSMSSARAGASEYGGPGHNTRDIRETLTPDETTETTMTHGSEAGEALALLSNGAVAGDTATVHAVPASLPVTGALVIQTSQAAATANHLAGQVFQIGTAPFIEASPGQLVVADLPGLALDRGSAAAAMFESPHFFQDPIGDGAMHGADWLADPSRSPALGTCADSSAEWPDQRSADQQPVLDPIAIVDRVFAALGEEMDDLDGN